MNRLGLATLLSVCMLSGISFAQDNCTYKTEEGYAHVVSAPSFVVVSINAKYPNVRLDAKAFPEKAKPAQVYRVQINESDDKNCPPVGFKIMERVQ